MGHILVDFDGTLVKHNPFEQGLSDDPEPVQPMVDRIKRWLADGVDVRIFTARACVPALIPAVQRWCEKHIGKALPVTNQKDFSTIEIWDDRAVRVEFNKGYVDNYYKG